MSSKHRRLFVFALASISLAISATQTLQAQGSAPVQRLSEEQLEQRMAGAENSWRLTAIDSQSQRDTVAPNIRAARNAFWRPGLQEYRDLEATNRSMYKTPGPSPSQELTLDPNDTWVIATFDHFLVVSVDPDFQLLYTEMNFKINQVVHQPSSSSLAPGMSFDMDIEGGKIKKANGDIVSWHIFDSSRYFVQPGHTYLMQIGSMGLEGLYYVGERWDVSTGKAVPDTDDLVGYALSGSSIISGRTTREAIAYLQSVLK
jgi:hypothetical protein